MKCIKNAVNVVFRNLAGTGTTGSLVQEVFRTLKHILRPSLLFTSTEFTRSTVCSVHWSVTTWTELSGRFGLGLRKWSLPDFTKQNWVFVLPNQTKFKSNWVQNKAAARTWQPGGKVDDSFLTLNYISAQTPTLILITRKRVKNAGGDNWSCLLLRALPNLWIFSRWHPALRPLNHQCAEVQSVCSRLWTCSARTVFSYSSHSAKTVYL